MAGVYRTKDRKGKPHPRWRFWYFDWKRKRRYGTGTRNKRDTLGIAWQIEDQHRKVFLGYLPPPTASQAAPSLERVIEEYLAWGRSQGGRGGRPWSQWYSRMREHLVKWWTEVLGLQAMPDLIGCLPKVEEELRKLQCMGRTGHTLQTYAEGLSTFCNWAVSRDYLDKNPVERLGKFDKTPKVPRRAMTEEEIEQLMAVSPPERQLLYETAICTGLRAKELRSLDVSDLDVKHSGLRLRAEWTKNRKSGFQPLPAELAEKLASFADSGVAQELYAARARSGKKAKPENQQWRPEAPLLHVPRSPSTRLTKDLEAADIKKVTGEGKVDFHALRVTYTTLVIEAGASVKEAQTLARHSDPKMTMNVYARTRAGRLHELANSVGSVIGVGSRRHKWRA